MVEIVDLTSSPEPDSAPNPARSHIRPPNPLSRMPFRESPAKRRKIHHMRDDDGREDATAPPSRFQTHSTPPARNGSNGNHDAGTTDKSKKKLTEDQDGYPPISQRQYASGSVPMQSAPMHAGGARTAASGAGYPSPYHALAQTNGRQQSPSMIPKDYPHGLPFPRPDSTDRTSNQLVQPSTSRSPPSHPPARPATVPSRTIQPPPKATPIPLPSASYTNVPLYHATFTPYEPTIASSLHATFASVPPLPIAAATPTALGVSVSSPLSAPLSTETGKPTKYPPWTPEEDCVIVYLKQGLGWSYKQIAPVLTGRSPGAANTRYSNRLKYDYDMKRAIGVIQNSKWASILQPDRHPELLARPVPVPPITAAEPAKPSRAFDSMPLTTAGTTTASQRERRAAQRPTNYYSKDHYANGIEDEPLPSTEPQKPPTDGHPSAQVAELIGTEIRGRRETKHRISQGVREFRLYKPYLSYHERMALKGGFEEGEWQGLDDWKGTRIHIPFSKDELKSLEHVITSRFNRTTKSILEDITEPQILEVASQAQSFLPTRTKESIEAFLRDATDGRLPKAEVLRFGGQKYPSPTVGSVLRNLELGMRTARRDYSKCGITHLQAGAIETIGPSLSFTGTSGDVNTVAWAPNGTQFAAGSACLVDPDSMQYNRPNNLLFGDASRKVLYEFPHHYTQRKPPETGVNSSHSMHVTQDRRLFQTVSMVAFSPDNSFLFTGGYDEFVRIYDIFNTVPPETDRVALRHTGKVDLLSVSPQGLLATGCQRVEKNSIRVINPYNCKERLDEDGNKLKSTIHRFSSRKAAERPDNGIYPSALRFDWSGDYLLAGFASTSKEELTSGETCLWDVRTGAQMTISPDTRSVFDVAWNTNRWKAPLFAVGCVAGANVNRGVRSVVKLYDIRAPENYYMTWELDCPALDMNDVLFSPYDDNLVVAGCTNGKTYVWDIRQPRAEVHLYSLVHGEPLMELGDDNPASRERLDTGVRFCSWAHDRRKLYTGASDGVVKAWDLYRAPEDIFERDVVQLNSGIMSGAFSPDYTSLLLGEVNGTVNVLEVGQIGRSIREMDSFDLIPSKDDNTPTPDDTMNRNSNMDKDSGIATVEELLQANQMTLRPMGGLPIRQAVQGPNYAGPYDNAEDASELRAAAAEFQIRYCDSPPTQQCDLPACREAASSSAAVPEEAGDSGRSAGRIPGALRSLARTFLNNDHGNGSSAKGSIGVPPVLKCSKCHLRPARPRAEADDEGDIDDIDVDVDDNGDGKDGNNDKDTAAAAKMPLCERCHFGCPRCGRKASILSRDDAITGVFCLRCRAVWRADVLGYKLLYQQPDDGDEDWDPRRDERFMYERARVMGIRKAPPPPPQLPIVIDSADGNSKKKKKNKKARRKETQRERLRRKGHDYLAADGEADEHNGYSCIEDYYHGLWQDRPASPL